MAASLIVKNRRLYSTGMSLLGLAMYLLVLAPEGRSAERSEKKITPSLRAAALGDSVKGQPDVKNDKNVSSATVVAKYHDLTLTAGEFRNEVPMVRRELMLTTEPLSTTQSEMVARRALIAKALRAKVEANPTADWPRLQELFNTLTSGEGMRQLLMTQLTTESTDTLWREAHAMMSKAERPLPTIKYHYIFLKSAGLSPEEVEKKHKKAEAALKRVNKGEDFVKVMKETSESSSVKDDPLELSPRTTGFDKQLLERLRAIPAGKNSEIVTTKAGFIIFHVVSTTGQENEPATFDDALKTTPTRQALARYASQMKTRSQIVRDRIEKRFGKVVAVDPAQALRAVQANENTPVLSLGGASITATQLGAWLRQNRLEINQSNVTNNLDELQIYLVCSVEAHDRKLADTFISEARWEPFRRSLVQRQYEQQQIANRPEPTDAMLREFLETHQNLFSTDTQSLSVCQLKLEISTGTNQVSPVQVLDEANRLRGLIEKGLSIREAAKQVRVAGLNGSVRCWENTAVPELQIDEVVIPTDLFKPGVELSEPLRLTNGYALLQITQRSTGRPTLEQAPRLIRRQWESQWLGEQIAAERKEAEQGVTYTDEFKQLVRESTPLNL